MTVPRLLWVPGRSPRMSSGQLTRPRWLTRRRPDRQRRRPLCLMRWLHRGRPLCLMRQPRYGWSRGRTRASWMASTAGASCGDRLRDRRSRAGTPWMRVRRVRRSGTGASPRARATASAAARPSGSAEFPSITASSSPGTMGSGPRTVAIQPVVGFRWHRSPLGRGRLWTSISRSPWRAGRRSARSARSGVQFSPGHEVRDGARLRK